MVVLEPDMGVFAFAKYEGLGNDFVVLEVASESALDPRSVPLICDRRRGVGADGVLLVLPGRAPGIAGRMRVLNADGSVPEMCGNGLRCVALHLAGKRPGHDDADLAVETDAGVRQCRVRRRSQEQASVDVDMGVVRVLEERALRLSGSDVRVVVVDAGNPHAVVLGSHPASDIDTLGPALARHSSFPRGTNVEMFRAESDVALEVIVWERGVGRTLACGTGACAVVAVACRAGSVRRGAPIAVRLPGGVLHVTHDATSGRTRLDGPARLVFRGEVAQAPWTPTAAAPS